MSQFNWIGKSQDGKTVTLKSLEDDFEIASGVSPKWIAENKELIRTGAVLDTETTGLKKSDEIIEIALRTFQFNKNTGELIALLDTYSALQEPSSPLSFEVQKITGLTDYDLRGMKIDWSKVDGMLSTVDLIIAHNASFDRPFVEKKSSVSVTKPWACSHRQIDWTSKGLGSSKLELLSIYHGFFTNAHRALNDVIALLHLLTMKTPNSEHPYLNELLTNARKPMVKVSALFSPFETKDKLKERGYSWDQTQKVWYKTLLKEDSETEIQWLASIIYNGDFKGQIKDIPVIENFK